MTLTYTYTRTYNVVDWANPYLVCDECGQFVTGWAPDSPAPGLLFPCEHSSSAHSVCPSWGPVDGCECQKLFGSVSHAEPTDG